MTDQRCETCQTQFVGHLTSKCGCCYAVEANIEAYLRSEKGVAFVENALMGKELQKDLQADLQKAQQERDDYRARKDGAYRERNQLVALLTKIFPAWLERHPESDKDWDEEWRTIVFLELPNGQQASWHVHDSHAAFFRHLSMYDRNSWDGHTTEEKYDRIARINRVSASSKSCIEIPGFRILSMILQWAIPDFVAPSFSAVVASADRNSDRSTYRYSPKALEQMAEKMVGLPFRKGIEGLEIGKVVDAQIKDGKLNATVYLADGTPLKKSVGFSASPQDYLGEEDQHCPQVDATLAFKDWFDKFDEGQANKEQDSNGY